MLVSNAETEVTLSGGQATVTQPGQAPVEPAYHFTLYDEITTVQDNKWSAAGVPFTVADQETKPQTGHPARVAGRILPDGSLIADLTEPAQPGELQHSFTGKLEKIDGSTWNVSGKDIQVDASTIFGDDLSLGSPIRVAFVVQDDGSWRALYLESLDTLAGFTLPPAASPDPDAKPRLSFEPEEVEVDGPCRREMGIRARLGLSGRRMSVQRTLPFGTPDEVRAQSRWLLEHMGTGSGFVFSPSHVLTHDVPVANVLAMLEVIAAANPATRCFNTHETEMSNQDRVQHETRNANSSRST